MKTRLRFIGFLVLLSSFMAKDTAYRYIPNSSFSNGETIEYKVHYGFVNAAEGKMTISDKLYRINDRVCYKVEVLGNSTGMFDFFIKIRDKWVSYIDTSAILTHKFYRIIEEGKYRKHEIVDFDHNKQNATVKTYHYKKKYWREPRTYPTKVNIQDLVSGYYYLRTVAFDKLNKGDIISMPAFFEDSVYNFQIRYQGRDEVKTKLGKMKALVISPVMPKNSLFDGENSIKVWISDDPRKIPLKVRAAMFVGAVEIEIKSYKRGKP